MEQKTINQETWHAAGTAGLILGEISSAYLFSGQLIAGNLAPATLWQQALSMVLWCIKFSLCIWTMKFFMTKFAQENKITDKKQVFKMGVAAALLSSLVYCGFYLANMLYISADFYDQVIGMTIQEMSGSLDSNSKDAIEKLLPMLPQIIFVSNFIYCFLFGTVLSAILSGRAIAQDPLNEFKSDEQ